MKKLVFILFTAVILATAFCVDAIVNTPAEEPIVAELKTAEPPEVDTEGLITQEIPETPAPKYYAEIPLSAELQTVLFEACDMYGVPYDVALAMIETESQFNPYIENSDSGCYGLCQLHPAYFPTNLSPADNIKYGIRYLGKQIRVYGTLESGLTAYAVGHDDGSRGYAHYVLNIAQEWNIILGGT